MSNKRCEECLNYVYDDYEGYYYCAVDMDEDEMERFLTRHTKDCPYYRYNDDYELSRKQ